MASTSAVYIAAPHKSSGKTTVTIAIIAELTRQQLRVQSFKKGPDYIDPMWHHQASGRPCHNLDYHTMEHSELLQYYCSHSADADVAVIEGNMGLFDSITVDGSQSNAALAKQLQIPVVLVMDVKGATRTWAAILAGLLQFESDLQIGGVILNNVAGKRHEQRLRQVLQHYLPQLPIVGAIHRTQRLTIEERHLGLMPSNESDTAAEQIEIIRSTIAPAIDWQLLRTIAATATTPIVATTKETVRRTDGCRIAIARDEAFGFYYASDLQQFARLGVELVPFSPLNDSALPDNIDGCFIGGGFPELFAAQLAANKPMRNTIASAIANGLPTYAECGGLMYLCNSITPLQGEKSYPMAGVIAAESTMTAKPVGRGYATVLVTTNHPWLDGNKSITFSAHEFHYSHVTMQQHNWHSGYQIQRGYGIDGKQDGVVIHNLLASYLHLRHCSQFPWVDYFVTFVKRCHYRKA